MEPAIQIQNLVKHYAATQAVAGVSFEVAAGEVFALLGPNGAGKTTTLECIIGLRRPDAGAIRLAGIDAIANPAQAKQIIGAQLQATALQDKITPRQALKLFGSFYEKPANVPQLLEQFDLSEKADKPFDTLSGGQRQRLALALALINDPQIVFLDEPTAGLDPQSRRDLHATIARIRATGRTILLTTSKKPKNFATAWRSSIAVKSSPSANRKNSSPPPRRSQLCSFRQRGPSRNHKPRISPPSRAPREKIVIGG